MGRVAEAAGAFEALLRDRSAAVDVRAYNAMVDALARNGDMAAAERMLERATDLADRQGARVTGLEYRGGLIGGGAGRGQPASQYLPLLTGKGTWLPTPHPHPTAGLPPPVEAFGAVVAGYARQLAVAPAVAAVKRFHAAGGSPDAPMLDILANIAIRAGDYRVAMQVGGAHQIEQGGGSRGWSGCVDWRTGALAGWSAMVKW